METIKKLVSRAAALAARVGRAGRRLLARAMPPREAMAIAAAAGLAFGVGVAYGRATARVPLPLPGGFVSVERIRVDATGAPAGSPSASAGATSTSPTSAASPVSSVPSASPSSSASSASSASAPSVGARPSSAASAPAPAASSATETLVLPVQGRIVSGFGWRKHPVYEDWRYHTGIDIGAPEGSPVRAALSGKVVEVGVDRELGLYVSIEHAGDLRTKYGHLGQASVSPGDAVRQGQQIGKTGSSGVTSGPYLHFEVVRGNKAQDPLGSP